MVLNLVSLIMSTMLAAVMDSDWLGADDRMAESVYIENSDLLACALNADCIGVCVCEGDGLALESRVKATYTD